MALPTLPLPPSGMPFIDPATGQVAIPWQNYLLALQGISLDAAPVDAKYWLSTFNTDLTDEANLGALTSGYVKITVALGVATPSSTATLAATDLAGTISDARLSSNVPLKDGTNVFTGPNAFIAGAGSTSIAPSGRVASITSTSATTGTVEEILATYTMPANTLNADGQAMRIVGGYTTANNGNNKTVKVRVGGIGGTVILTYTSATNNGSVWYDALLTRRTNTTAYGNGFASDGATSAVTGAVNASTYTGAIALVVTGTTGAALGDMTLQQADFVYLG